MISIPESSLRTVISYILESSGSNPSEAQIVTDHLVRANLAGHDSHGVGLIPNYMASLKAKRLKANQHVKLIKDSGSIMMFDGDRGYGQVQGKEAMEQAIARCKETGLVLMTLKDAHHIGRIGTYGEQSIAEELISIHFVNVTDHEPTVAPYGGTKARFVTNPICIAMPGTQKTDPILLDMATSKIALGKARVAMNKGVPTPDGSVIDANGEPSNDGSVLFKEPMGALLPFGDYKGTGLALMCELLAGGLSGGGTIQPEKPRLGGIVNNMTTLLLDPQHLVDMTWFKHEIDSIVAYVKSTPAQAQTGPVKIAGEPEKATQQARKSQGIPLAEAAWEGIISAGESIGASREEISKMLS